YINPKDLLKMATTNVCYNKINDVVGKSTIDVGNDAEFIVLNSFSKNPYLNIINRCESKNILYTINKIVNV
ncbi:MAG: chlorohydrolase, partial [Methanobrevibacter sp.]|nr:chlorohydrolase [Methanobrevibacter sp.]